MSTPRVWVDGTLIDPTAPVLTAIDHGLTVGDGVFETAKIVDGRGFALTRHARRLDRSLAGLGLPPADHAHITEGIEAVLAAAEPITLGRLRYTVTAGPGPLGSDRAPGSATYVVTAVATEPPPASVALAVVPWTRNERAATAGLKTTSYAENVIALAYAKERGAGEAIFANTRDELCEGTGSNVFLVKDGTVFTPPLESGCLAGITRELVVQWCHADGIALQEVPLALSEIYRADEVFITSSTRDVMAVHAVDETAYALGPVTAAVAEAFRAHCADGIDP